MFCPLIGVPEDPVSGNAHGMLGVYLLHHGLLAADEGKARLVGHQGRFVDRPGSVYVEVTAEAGKRATGVRVTGDAVIVYQAELSL
jgi:PhzF family phenazine biosynthesis protein